MLDIDVYSPWGSYNAITGAGNYFGAQGRAYYTDGGGNRSAVFQYSDYRRTGPGSYYYYNARGGTQESLLGKVYVTNATSYIYSRDDSKIINTEVASRACVLTPITE